MLADIPRTASQFVYLKYYPWFGAEYPDPIDYLTQDLHGTVYGFHSAEQFRQSVQKMLMKVAPKQPPDTQLASGDATGEQVGPK
jgi:hypothetical protein